jgi:hypothetical protein
VYALGSACLTSGYSDNCPELDSLPLLNDKLTSCYQGLIGILQWATELGRLDILMPVSLMSSYMAAPREGHLKQLLHIFGYLKSHDRSRLVSDDTIMKADSQNVTGQSTIPGQRICFHQTCHSHKENRSWSCALSMLTMLDVK